LTGSSTSHGYSTVRMSLRFASRGVYHGALLAQQGDAPDKKKDKGMDGRWKGACGDDTRLRRRCA
jgi:hypothetical protein